jgi:hypothetical protein
MPMCLYAHDSDFCIKILYFEHVSEVETAVFQPTAEGAVGVGVGIGVGSDYASKASIL